MSPQEVDFLINGFNDMYKVFSEAVSELKGESEHLVYRTESEAYTKTSLNRTYWDRVRYRIPYLEIPPEQAGGEPKRVYPVAAVKEWIEKNTIYPEGK
ncbi:hypothetical protein ACRHK7_04425 [Weissella tructae]|uniref:Uncharacterized protein n=3 Tax=Weissella TaxID=46255 RepID=A0A075TXN0_9LACO|nr:MULTISPECIES: hypothetical protein [Weissella]AIG65086.1 hypothetical protein WS08_0147 [Weissella tructae]AIM62400.1 hypothetical protein WS74_0148 [Weissella ceti]ELA07931.1 hypothetical protein WCNC_00515 [Weissella ceti NC36]QVV91483.1 hypothetical protein KHQ32_00865 [Weissella tructae]